MSGDVRPRGEQLVLGGESADGGESSTEAAGGRDPPGGVERKGTKRAASSDGGRSEPADHRGPDERSWQRALNTEPKQRWHPPLRRRVHSRHSRDDQQLEDPGWEHGRAGADGDGGDQGPDLRGDAVGVQETPEGGDGCSEEGGDGSFDGMGSQVSIPEQRVERRLGLQHPGQHEEQVAHLSMEEAGVADEDQGSGAPGVQGEGAMEEEHQMAQLSAELRGGVALGPLRGNAAETEEQRLCGAEVWGRANPQRGLMQKLKNGMQGLGKPMRSWPQSIASRRSTPSWRSLRAMPTLTEVATLRAGWVC